MGIHFHPYARKGHHDTVINGYVETAMAPESGGLSDKGDDLVFKIKHG